MKLTKHPITKVALNAVLLSLGKDTELAQNVDEMKARAREFIFC